MHGRSRREYLAAIPSRDRRTDRREKQVILNAFCRHTGYPRKYAIRRLNGPPPQVRQERPRRRRRRDDLPRAPRDRRAAGEADDPTVGKPVAALRKLRPGLDRFELRRQMDRKLHRLDALAPTRRSPRVPPNGKSPGVTF